MLATNHFSLYSTIKSDAFFINTLLFCIVFSSPTDRKFNSPVGPVLTDEEKGHIYLGRFHVWATQKQFNCKNDSKQMWFRGTNRNYKPICLLALHNLLCLTGLENASLYIALLQFPATNTARTARVMSFLYKNLSRWTHTSAPERFRSWTLWIIINQVISAQVLTKRSGAVFRFDLKSRALTTVQSILPETRLHCVALLLFKCISKLWFMHAVKGSGSNRCNIIGLVFILSSQFYSSIEEKQHILKH